MKKLFAIILSSFFAAFSLSGQAITAKVVSVSGKVEVMKGNGWEALTPGTLLSRGDIVSTGFNSEAVFSVKESTITLSALTRMTIEQLTENDVKEQAQFFIDSGKLTASVKHAENKRTDFKVRSPVSTASVRGTLFSFWATGKAFATFGMLAAEKSTSNHAVIADDDTPSAFLPPAKVSSVFTSIKEVGGGAASIPLFAGQGTQSDEVTGRFIPPQVQLFSQSQSLPGFVAALGESLANSGLAALNTVSNTKDGSDANPATGSVVVTLKFSDN